jgi:Leucine-rich repeat (LRR) protein
MNIINVSLTNTRLKSIEPLDQIYPNLDQLSLFENHDLLNFESLPCFLNLKQFTLKNTTTLWEIPPQIFQLPLLVSLDLKDCIFTQLPECIGDLKHLRSLNISHSDATVKKLIRTLPKSIYLLSEL